MIVQWYISRTNRAITGYDNDAITVLLLTLNLGMLITIYSVVLDH
jgi:hypothetical protein